VFWQAADDRSEAAGLATKQSPSQPPQLGMITDPVQADQIVRSGQGDLLLLARELLLKLNWPLQAAGALHQSVASMLEMQVEGPNHVTLSQPQRRNVPLATVASLIVVRLALDGSSDHAAIRQCGVVTRGICSPLRV
jgi:hypothetical protein